MRPETLELEGFTAFRQKTCIEFGDADLFAFTGPTGAGKSSLIDAMIFALYGKVPRLGGQRVEPVITQGRQEARVRLDFTLGDDDYTAVRVVRRNQSGATTKEARLERGEEVLAGNATALDREIHRLLGLDFQQFTTCVALPQGEFDRFLRKTPGGRQALLSKLLGLGVYERVRNRAHGRKEQAKGRIAALEGQLATLTEFEEAVEDRHRIRVASLERLQGKTSTTLKRQSELDRERDRVEADRTRTRAHVEALTAARTPQVAFDLGEARHAAEERLQKMREALGTAEKQRDDARCARTALGDVVEWSRTEELWTRRERLEGLRETAARQEERAKARLRSTQESCAEAETEALDASKTLDRVERTHRAHALRSDLVVGEPCPVCEQEVPQLPAGREATAIDALRSTVDRAQRAEESARARRDAASRAHAAAEREKKTRDQEYDAVTVMLRGRSGPSETEQALAAIVAADRVLKQAEECMERKRRAARDADREVSGFPDRESEAWSRFAEVRDRLSELKPPTPERAHLLRAWQTLETWATAKLSEVRQFLADHEADAERLDAERASLREGLCVSFSECALTLGEDPQRMVDQALDRARVDLHEVQRQRRERRRLQREIIAARKSAEIAAKLHTHLHVNRFEQWLLTAAFRQLTADASRILNELSGGRYSFRHNEDEFDIVDHGNADETRSSKTLSGGETFLASLALALALSDRIADLAAEGAARLESIFLDEGFGSLDADTLDTVAATIEELGAKGRTVGLVTHVRDLAERIPVQFRVSKTSATASVERIAV